MPFSASCLVFNVEKHQMIEPGCQSQFRMEIAGVRWIQEVAAPLPMRECNSAAAGERSAGQAARYC
jgi:hypothetical protein